MLGVILLIVLLGVLLATEVRDNGSAPCCFYFQGKPSSRYQCGVSNKTVFTPLEKQPNYLDLI